MTKSTQDISRQMTFEFSIKLKIVADGRQEPKPIAIFIVFDYSENILISLKNISRCRWWSLSIVHPPELLSPGETLASDDFDKLVNVAICPRKMALHSAVPTFHMVGCAVEAPVHPLRKREKIVH